MNEKIKELMLQAGYAAPEMAARANKLAELIVREHIKLLQQQWYDLNNEPAVADESPRDIGIRVGKKGEIINLMAKIKEHFGEKQ